MKQFTIIYCIFFTACSGTMENKEPAKRKMPFTETEVLKQLDLAFKGIPSEYFPAGSSEDIKYNFFLDLEHGYCETAGNRIHLYADSARWIIVFEKSGYQNRASDAEIELNYIGNCINYPVDKYSDRNYITNSSRVILIDAPEFDRIENKDGKDLETFELIAQDTKQIKVHNKLVPFDNDYRNYEKAGIKIRDYDNPKKLIGFGDLVRYLNETNPSVIGATEEEIRLHMPPDIPKLMTINEFHFVSVYDKSSLPSEQETYQLIAKVLVTRDTTFWKPTLNANNHWTNWESGNL